MRFDIMTLFPDVVRCVLESSIIGRAQQNGHITVQAHDIRDYTLNKHKKTDDTPYGGGKGMLMATQPICDCFEAVCKNHAERPLGDPPEAAPAEKAPHAPQTVCQHKARHHV